MWSKTDDKKTKGAGDPEAPSVEEIFSMEKALSERPEFSIRFRITLAFLVLFLFSFGIGISSMVYISMMNSKQTFFEHASKFVVTVEQARRHEKNFFLYHTRTDLFDAIGQIRIATSILANTANEMRSLLKQETFQKLKNDMSNYEILFNEIVSRYDPSTHPDFEKNSRIESRLRTYGHQILTYATDLMDQERNKFHEAAHTFMLTAIFSLIINFIVMVWVATELSRQILQPLGRAVQYTQRIAAGDFSLVIPQRKFRDEFSNLAIAINRMIFELMENHKQLLQSRKMAAVGTLTSGIAHELNNPLNNISITAESLIGDLDAYSHEEILDMLKDIFTQVERASGTVRNLLDFTRLEQSKIETINVPELLQSSLQLVNNERVLNAVSIDVQMDEDLPKIKGNFRNLQQIFLNLFLNGIQAMPEGGTLSVRATETDNGFVKVDVKDNGCGISRENLEKVFDPFFTTKDVGKGTGLGLSVSYGIVQNIGGNITVDSEEGKWTVFSVCLPTLNSLQ